jgi:hypothetical protein
MEPTPISGLTAEEIDAQRRDRAADPNYRSYDRGGQTGSYDRGGQTGSYDRGGQTGRSVPHDGADRQFLEINGVVVNADHIVEVDFGSGAAAVMHMSSGNCRTFVGEDAAALRRFFAPQNTGAPPAAERPAFDAETLRRGDRVPLPLQSGSALYVRPGAPDIVVSNDEERNLAIERGYRPALAEALPAGVETVRYADGTSATGVAPLPRVSVNGAPAVGDENVPAPDGGQADPSQGLPQHQVWEK